MVRQKLLLPISLVICIAFLAIFHIETEQLSKNNIMRLNYSGIEPIRIETHRHGEEFCIAYNVTIATKLFREDGMEPITLATHLTANFLNELLRQAQNWSAPISASLFIDGATEEAVDLFYNVHRCYKNVEEKVSLHVVFRLAAFEQECAPIFISEMDCGNITDQYLSSMIDSFRTPFSLYPINLMRNTARRGSSSRLQLLSDVEMRFSKNFPSVLKPLANSNLRNGGKRRIIIRRFEEKDIYESAPEDVAELQRRYENKTLIQYHARIFPEGHKITNIKGWFNRSLELEKPILMAVKYPGPSWEPQILLHSTDPESDEEAPTRQRDQQVLIYELCRANYTFMVASHVFNVHPGIKRKRSPMENAISRYTQPLRIEALANIKRRIDDLYPDTVDRCRSAT